MATKFEAFNDRGTDYRTSHDFEDIIYVIDNRTTIVEEIENDQKEIRDFIKQELNKILESSNTYEILSCYIHPLVLEGRYLILEEKIKKIIELD